MKYSWKSKFLNSLYIPSQIIKSINLINDSWITKFIMPNWDEKVKEKSCLFRKNHGINLDFNYWVNDFRNCLIANLIEK